MPFDGLSFTDPGYRITSPSEMNIKTELSSQTQAKTFIKKLDESHKVSPDGKNKGENNGNSQKDKKDEENSEDKANLPALLKESTEIAKYKVSFNQGKDMVELIDRKSGQIIETISPGDLLTLVSKSKTASGILVDRVI